MGELSPLEVEVIDLFVNAVRLVGISKSVGEIYGLLYISPEPLPLDVIVAKLRISKGSGSQGLKFLRSVGAVRPVYVPGDRRDHFAAVAELKQLVSGFIREELLPHLETGDVRLERLRCLSGEAGKAPGPEPDFYAQRVAKLGQWHRRARQILPFMNRFLSD